MRLRWWPTCLTGQAKQGKLQPLSKQHPPYYVPTNRHESSGDYRNLNKERRPVVLIAQNAAHIYLRVGIFEDGYLHSLTHSSRTRSDSKDEGTFLNIYTFGPYNLCVGVEFEHVCRLLLARALTRERVPME